jgi:hypothetical protein
MQNISKLILGKNYQITDDILDLLIKCKNLSYLDLSECPLITEKGIKNLIENLAVKKPTIKINSSLCLKNRWSDVFSDSKRKSLVSKKNLVLLKLEKCPKISKECIEFLQHHYIISVPYCI